MAKLTKEAMCGALKSNAGMITVYRQNADGAVSIVMRTFRVDQVLKYLHRKELSRYSVSQDDK